MKNSSGMLWSGFSHLLYWSGIGPFSSWIWRRATRDSWTVLAYHRVGETSSDGGPDHVSSERFRRHLRHLKTRYDIVTVGEALAKLQGDTMPTRPLLSLTFDDGYADNTACALPVLLEEGCRATLYPTLEAIEEGRPPWTHRLARDLRRCALGGGFGVGTPKDLPEILVTFLVQSAHLSERALAARIASVIDRAKTLRDSERRQFCESVAEMAGGGPSGDRDMLDGAMLKRWQSAGMEVGSHTARHPILSRTESTERRSDLARARTGLERILGAPVLHLAYPNGRSGDWDDGTVADARSTGYASAATTIAGINRRDVDPFAIRRISVGNDSVPVLAARISPVGILLRSVLRSHEERFRPRKERAATRAPMANPLRIAFIGGRGIGSAYSGIERYYEEVGSRLAGRGHRVLIYCRPHFVPAASVYRGIEVRRLPTVRAKHLETLIHSILATVDVCFRRVDLVQFHALGSSPLAWIPRLAGKRTVVSVRGLDWQRAKWGRVARTYLRFCERTSVYCPDATAVVSRTLQRHFEARFKRAVRYIPNGVAPVEIVPPREIRRWGLEHRGYFLYAGRLSPEKGLDIMIEAHKTVRGPRLVLAGGSSYSDEYVERLRAAAGENTVFTGFLTGSLLQEIYSNALAFVLPSHMEGLSIALLEAMSYGLPVIASDIPENRELIDECGGYLFRLDDVTALRQVMERVAASPEEALRVGAKARNEVRAHFDWDRIVEATADFYADVAGGVGAAMAPRVPSITRVETRTTRSDRGMNS